MGLSESERTGMSPRTGEILTRFIQNGGAVQVLPPENELTKTVSTPKGKQIHCYGIPLQVPIAIRRRQLEAAQLAESVRKNEITILKRRRPLITKATILPKSVLPTTNINEALVEAIIVEGNGSGNFYVENQMTNNFPEKF